MRQDVEIYNEATGWIITSQDLAGNDLSNIDSDTEGWAEAVADGIFIPIELVQDDSISARVVVNEDLSSTELEEAVGHFTSRLRISDGVLTLSGGMEYLWGEEMEDYTVYFNVPSGDYQVDIYTYLPWLNGSYCLGEVDKEPLGTYFRRTRPGTPFPAWLESHCISEPELDPGHEKEWSQKEEEEEQDSYINFLVHLTPTDNWNTTPIVELNEDGWVDIELGARRPALCPLGIIYEGE